MEDYATNTAITRKKHNRGLLQAFLVTLLWSSSWVLIKISLDNALPALTFAGLRYTLAFLCLAPLVFLRQDLRTNLRIVTWKSWLLLLVFGIVCYTLAQGALFTALQYIPAATISLLLNLTPVIVAIFGILLIREIPTTWQWLGIVISIFGLIFYFRNASFPREQVIGIIAATACMLANTGSTLLGRHINSKSGLHPTLVTFISMGFGSVLLLATGFLTQGIGNLSLQQWLVIIWLAIVNTALAWSLWNRTLRILTAVESSIMNTLILPQTALLALVFLGEELTITQIGGLVLVTLGTIVVQFRHSWLSLSWVKKSSKTNRELQG